MRTAERIIEDYLGGNLNISTLTMNAWSEIINVARKECIKECAEKVTVTDPYQDGRKFGLRDGNLENYIKNNPAKIDKQSILSLINELK